MIPTISSVKINPVNLKKGDTEVTVEATVSDDVGVTEVGVLLNHPFKGTIANISLAIISGDALKGTYLGIVHVPLDIMDGTYQIVVVALNALSVEGDNSTFAGYESDITLERGVIGGGGQAGDGPVDGSQTCDGPVDGSQSGDGQTGGGAEPHTNECCCKVIINVSEGPVNIYVCRADSIHKIDTPNALETKQNNSSIR
jgi:hypothetical protein